MSKKPTKPNFFTRLLDQVAGNMDPGDILIPEYCVIGTGDIWCYDPADHALKQVSRGTKVFVIQKNYANTGRYLVYTERGYVVCMDPEELILTGFD